MSGGNHNRAEALAAVEAELAEIGHMLTPEYARGAGLAMECFLAVDFDGIGIAHTLRIDDDKAAALVDRAATSAHAFDSAVRLLAGALRDGKDVPLPLAAFGADVLEGKRSRPVDRGRPRKNTRLRDEGIERLVEIATSFELAATRNDWAKHNDSACDVVAEAMRRAGLSPSSYSGVKRALSSRQV